MSITLIALLLVSAAIIVSTYIVERSKGLNVAPVITITMVVYWYGAFGQALLVLFHLPIYRGIVKHQVVGAIGISVLAMAAFGISALIGSAKLRRSSEAKVRNRKPKNTAAIFGARVMVGSAIACLTLLLLVIAATHIQEYSLPKNVRIASVGGLHYPIMLAWPALFIAYQSLTWRIDLMTVLSTACYIAYCILMSERDFIFILLAIALMYAERRAYSPRILISSSIGLVFVTVVSAYGRGGVLDDQGIVGILSQGSNLFVNTQVLEYLSRGGYMLYGASYGAAFADLFTAGLVPAQTTLSEWLSEIYGGRTGAYGFSLEAEAYLNFGLPGVAVLFAGFGALLMFACRNASAGRMSGRFLFLWFIVFFLYQLRQESFSLIKSFAYSGAVLVTSLAVGAILYRVGIIVRRSNRSHDY